MARVASAKRHAQAVFQIALEKNEVDKWKSDLNTIASTLGDPRILAILEDPKIHFREKQQLVNKLLPGFSQLALNFAYFMVAKQRLTILNQVVAEYEKMANAYQGLEHARVTTAVPIEREEQEKLRRIKRAKELAVMDDGICEECGKRGMLYRIHGMLVCDSCRSSI